MPIFDYLSLLPTLLLYIRPLQRAHLLNAAPFMAHPLPIIIPVYTWWEIPYMWAGAKAYDLVAGKWGACVSVLFPFQCFPCILRLRVSGLVGVCIAAGSPCAEIGRQRNPLSFTASVYHCHTAQTYNYALVLCVGVATGKRRALPASYYIDREEALYQFPMLKADGLKGKCP